MSKNPRGVTLSTARSLERDAIMFELYPSLANLSVIRDALNALPGRPLTLANLSTYATILGLRRSSEYRVRMAFRGHRTENPVFSADENLEPEETDLATALSWGRRNACTGLDAINAKRVVYGLPPFKIRTRAVTDLKAA